MPRINRPLTLDDLPAPPPGKVGWPWTEQSTPLSDHIPDSSVYPRISIVTPSYNQGQFIEETIRSVLLQGYPSLEYIIIDGGSIDESVKVIKKYEPFLAYWVSEQDKGQADALNKGFEISTGSLCAYLNSDDLLLRNALNNITEYFIQHPDKKWFASVCLIGVSLEKSKAWKPHIASLPIFVVNQTIAQQGVFWRESIKKKPWFDVSRKMRMDHKFFAEIYFNNSAPFSINKVTSFFRQHSDSKTYTLNSIDQEERRQLVEEFILKTNYRTSQAIRDEYLRFNNIALVHNILANPSRDLASKWKKLRQIFHLFFITPYLWRDRIFISAFIRVLLNCPNVDSSKMVDN